jgi:uncharacterized protein YjiS (DUF1127 family)
MVANRVPAQLLRLSAQRERRPTVWSKAAEALENEWLHAGDALLLWRQRTRERRALNALSDHMLKDLGLSRSDTERESAKRFWEG